jgi:hypothetical protein
MARLRDRLSPWKNSEKWLWDPIDSDISRRV